jgi:hypothetical protein
MNTEPRSSVPMRRRFAHEIRLKMLDMHIRAGIGAYTGSRAQPAS